MAKQLVYIGGAGRSGSTLLDMLMGNSPLVQSVGEVHRLSWYARTDRESCTCGESVTTCPFWGRVESEAVKAYQGESKGPLMQELDPMLRPEDLSWFLNQVEKGILVLGNRMLFRSFLRGLAPKHLAALQNSYFWYEMIRRATGKPIILDSTKDPRRLRALFLFEPESFKLIFLVRDGRAVAASDMRRTGVDMRTAAGRWVDANRRSLVAQRGIPADKIHFVRYEDLCTDPGAQVERVCRFIGIDFSPEFLNLDKDESHNIGGNPMRFRKGERAIKLDNRWVEQLSPRDLDVFLSVAGAMNAKFGFTE